MIWGGGGNILKSWHYEFFKLLGLSKERILIISQPTQFSQITVPEESAHTTSHYAKEYPQIYQHIAKNANQNIKIKTFEKIFLSHRKWLGSCGFATCKCVNEEVFENFFKQLGYHIIFPEELSIERQIQVISNAKSIVSTLGTTTHFALFCPTKTQFFMLTRVRNDPLIQQLLINQATRIDWYIIDVSKNFLYADRSISPLNSVFTDDFKNFIAHKFGKETKALLDKFASHIDDTEYIKEWTKFYSKPENYPMLEKLTVFDFIDLFSTELLHIPLDRNRFFPQKIKIKHSIAYKIKRECKRIIRQIKNKL